MENKNMIDIELENVSGGAQVSATHYRIEYGDTLGNLASRFNTTVANLMAMNPQIKNADRIYAGDLIRIS